MELRPGADSLVMERGGVYNWLETQLYLWPVSYTHLKLLVAPFRLICLSGSSAPFNH